jgi:hypothetical protein
MYEEDISLLDRGEVDPWKPYNRMNTICEEDALLETLQTWW